MSTVSAGRLAVPTTRVISPLNCRPFAKPQDKPDERSEASCHPDEHSEEGAPAKYVNEVNNFVGKKGSPHLSKHGFVIPAPGFHRGLWKAPRQR